MDNFKAIYKILKLLDKHKGDESFDYELISAESLKIRFSAWEWTMIELQINGYVRGVEYEQSISDNFPHVIEPVKPTITLKGLEYLSENSLMRRAASLVEGIKDPTPYI